MQIDLSHCCCLTRVIRRDVFDRRAATSSREMDLQGRPLLGELGTNLSEARKYVGDVFALADPALDSVDVTLADLGFLGNVALQRQQSPDLCPRLGASPLAWLQQLLDLVELLVDQDLDVARRGGGDRQHAFR